MKCAHALKLECSVQPWNSDLILSATSMGHSCTGFMD